MLGADTLGGYFLFVLWTSCFMGRGMAKTVHQFLVPLLGGVQSDTLDPLTVNVCN